MRFSESLVRLVSGRRRLYVACVGVCAASALWTVGEVAGKKNNVGREAGEEDVKEEGR